MKFSDTSRREEKITAANGIELYSLKSPGLHGFCLCVYAKAGVLYEESGEHGISHFVEHIVFRNINAIMGGKLYDVLDEAGLTFTAATYKEFIQFCITGESSKFSLAGDILLKLFEKLSANNLKEDFELERGRVRAEIREYDEKASLDWLVKSKVWGKTALTNMITGTLGDVSKITVAKCEKAREKMFTHGNFFFYATGNYDDADLSDLARRAGMLDIKRAEARNNLCELPCDYMNRKGEVLTKDASYYMVEMCFDFDVPSAPKPVRNLFYDMMFAGENCRFFKALSEDMGYIYSYDAKIEEYKNAGNLSISYEVSLKDLYESLDMATDLFNRMKNDAEGLSRAKVFYTSNACLSLDNAEELNWNMAYENYILDEKIKSIDDKRERYEMVSEKDITDLARRVFKTSNLVVGIKGRRKKLDFDRMKGIFAKLDNF